MKKTVRHENILMHLKERYPIVSVPCRGSWSKEPVQPYFRKGNLYFIVSEVPFLGGFVVEYAENEDYAASGGLEDGDVFPYELTDDEILDGIIKEIEA
ncbi:MAG: hypothetical protein IJJ25_14605 [Lachnospiraceae bacterium]|nr:hypothetical protein [Lachnospiraceae bacterium]